MPFRPRRTPPRPNPSPEVADGVRRQKRLPPPTPSEAAFAQLVRDFGTIRHAPEGALRQAQGDRAATQGDSCHPELVEGPSSTQAGAFLDALYEKAGDYLSR